MHPRLSQVNVQASTDFRHLTDEQLREEIRRQLESPEVRHVLTAARVN